MFGGMCCEEAEGIGSGFGIVGFDDGEEFGGCLLYTSDAADE